MQVNLNDPRNILEGIRRHEKTCKACRMKQECPSSIANFMRQVYNIKFGLRGEK